VYSLGAILFEILTLHPLCEADTLPQVVDAAHRGIEARPSRRYPEIDVPPELETAIVQATAFHPAERFASTRELAEAVERYLDGDRDVARRRELASQHLARAERAIERGSPEARRNAMAEASRAVALDPESDAALGLLARLLVELPAELPPEAARELERRQARTRSEAARIGMGAFALRLAFFPLAVLMGVRLWGLAGVILALLVGSVALAFWLWRRRTMDLWHGALLIGVSTLSIVLIGAVFGSYLLVPPMILMNNVTFALHAGPRLRRTIMVLGAIAVLVPLGLEWSGVLPPAYAFADGKLLVLPRLVDFPPLMTLTLLTLSTVALVTLPVVFFGRARDALVDAERRLFHQAWHLRNLVPERIRRSLAKTDPGDPTR
jgi:serine/threonine-protein kinase